MIDSPRPPGRSRLRASALLGLAGAVLSGVGDVLILGRRASGVDFDQAAGVIPAHVEADDPWRSLWNGVSFSSRRIHVGTMIGLVGIGCLQWAGLRGVSRALPPGGLRRAAGSAATAFAVSGVLTHLCCGRVILAYQQASRPPVEPAPLPHASPPAPTTLLAVSAAGALAALAVFSGCLAGAALRPGPTPRWWAAVTPFAGVVSTLSTFGRLPFPVGGYARPASMSIGLLIFFAVVAATAGRDARPDRGEERTPQMIPRARWGIASSTGVLGGC